MNLLKGVTKVKLAMISLAIVAGLLLSSCGPAGPSTSPTAAPPINMSAALTAMPPSGNYGNALNSGAVINFSNLTSEDITNNMFASQDLWAQYGDTECFGAVDLQKVVGMFGANSCYQDTNNIGTLMAQRDQIKYTIAYWQVMGEVYPQLNQLANFIADNSSNMVFHHFIDGRVAFCTGARQGLTGDLHPDGYGGGLLWNGRVNPATGNREGGYCQSDCQEKGIKYGQVGADGTDCTSKRFEVQLGVMDAETASEDIASLAQLQAPQLQPVGMGLQEVFGGSYLPQFNAVLRASTTKPSGLEYLVRDTSSAPGFNWMPVVNIYPEQPFPQYGYFFGIDGTAYNAVMDTSHNYTASVATAADPVIITTGEYGQISHTVWIGNQMWAFSDRNSYQAAYKTLEALGMATSLLDSLNPVMSPWSVTDGGQWMYNGEPVSNNAQSPMVPGVIPIEGGVAPEFTLGEFPAGLLGEGLLQPIPILLEP